MFPVYSLTLMVNHACNLRCTYCYTGEKKRRPMSDEVAHGAIRRAIRSIPEQGRLELAFFGGEPLLEAASILNWVNFARDNCAEKSVELKLNMTTNGTVTQNLAWKVMTLPEMSLSISHDGLPAVHDRHRVSTEGQGSSNSVLATIDRLIHAGRDFNVVMVVRPDNLETVAEGIDFLRQRGVTQITPSLDLWTVWTRDDSVRLQQTVRDCADLWRRHWPELSISWFDEKGAKLARVPATTTARCQFGHGQIAVSPAGSLYPCERLIGEDRADNPMRLAGHVLQGTDFCQTTPTAPRSAPACSACSLETMCGTSCRCSNFIRTGDPTRPDGLLCWLETLCFRETLRVLSLPASQSTADRSAVPLSSVSRIPLETEEHHVCIPS